MSMVAAQGTRRTEMMGCLGGNGRRPPVMDAGGVMRVHYDSDPSASRPTRDTPRDLAGRRAYSTETWATPDLHMQSITLTKDSR